MRLESVTRQFLLQFVHMLSRNRQPLGHACRIPHIDQPGFCAVGTSLASGRHQVFAAQCRHLTEPQAGGADPAQRSAEPARRLVVAMLFQLPIKVIPWHGICPINLRYHWRSRGQSVCRKGAMREISPFHKVGEQTTQDHQGLPLCGGRESTFKGSP
ncbi:hypothetical protein APR50_21505 [Variovorax paradoxus]|nr:hypothetical protein APR52_40475 [Variovorax paradoxus]KPV00370.1 hypothetical protein APR49_33940 [Variovorax paradoxus]KPV04648.1 hypothetical protein APR50_21505 [Variovorax paradoxus]KPV18184.1 hypothetical protein APR47_41805 [Variovorax paradoxus]KPV20348.1 hypothetical protein APR51_17360 [Variovorax paradoxus]